MRFRRSISLLLTISLSAAVISVATIFIAYNYITRTQKNLAELNNRADEYIEVLQTSLKLPLWHFEKQMIINVATAFSLNDLVILITVKDSNGDTVITVENEELEDYIARSAEVRYHGVHAGTVTIMLSSKYHKDINQKLLTSNIAMVLFVVILLMVMTRLILRYFLSKPLDRLNLLAAGYSTGIYDSDDDQNTYSEFQRVISTMEILGQKIKNQMRTIQDTEQKYRSIFENAVEGIYQITPDLKEINVNPSLARLLGYETPEDLINSGDDVFYSAFFSRKEFHNFIDHINDRKSVYNLEWKLKKPDGTDVWILLSGRAIPGKDGEVAYYEGSVIDITKRKLAEEESSSLKQYLSSIFDSMPSILVGIDSYGCVTYWNKKAEEETGIVEDSAKGKKIQELLPHLAKPLEEFYTAISKNKPQLVENIPVQKKEESKYLNMLIYPLSLESERGAVVRIDDITERVRMEQVMIQSEKMVSVGGLAAGMAHEINNPLGGIMLGIQNLQRRFSAQSSANVNAANECDLKMHDLQTYLEKRKINDILSGMRVSILRASEIISNMLQFSRKSEAKMTPQNLNDICDRIIQLANNDYDLKKKYDFRSITITKEYDSDLAFIYCNETEIGQVILNLLRNSAQAMLDQGDSKSHEIEIKTSNRNKSVQLEIADNGPGMPENVRQRIFEPFYTTKPVGQGTGLGLSVSYMIITNNHQGAFEVESELGKGTRFIIRLPISQDHII